MIGSTRPPRPERASRTAHAAAGALLSLLVVAPALGQDLYWVEVESGCTRTLIRHKSVGSTTTENLIESNETNLKVVVDPAGRHLYWLASSGGTQRIRRANLDMLGVVEVASASSQYSLESFVLDVPHGKIFWLEANGCSPCGGGGCPVCPRIRRANLDGTSPETLFDFAPGGNYNAADLAVDAAAGKVYWADRQFPPYLSRANFDGSNPEPVVTATDPMLLLGGIYYLALDVPGGKAYWIETDGLSPGASFIKRGNLDGSGMPEPLITYPSSQSRPQGLVVDPLFGAFYWTLSESCPATTSRLLRTDFARTRLDELGTGLGSTLNIDVVPSPSTTTTSTTLPPGGCTRAATLDSIGCRLGVVRQTITGASGLGGLQASLGGKVDKARGKLDQAGASCAQSKLGPARKGLAKAGKLVGACMTKIGSRRGRKIIAGPLVDELLAALTPIRDDLGSLRGGLACP